MAPSYEGLFVKQTDQSLFLAEQGISTFRELADRFFNEGLSFEEFTVETQEILQNAYEDQASLLDNTEEAVVVALIAAFIAGQMNFFDQLFSQDNIDRYSPAQLSSWFGQYSNTGRHFYERLQQLTLGIPELPGFPGVGTLCRLNCKCFWEHTFDTEGWLSSHWRLSPAEHCTTCLERSAKWHLFRN